MAIREIARALLPPLVVDGVRRMRALWRGTRRSNAGTWRRVTNGVLAGHELRLPGEPWADAMLAGRYEPVFTAAVAEAVAPGGVCYDLGGHVGYYTLVMALRAGPRGEVHVFEPYAPNAARIREHVARNADAAERAPVYLHPCAVADRNGTHPLVAPAYAHDESPLAHLAGAAGVLKPGWRAHFTKSREQQTEVWRLDDWRASTGARPPDVIKIDVEGSELDVLRGARETLIAARPTLLVELHNARLAAECGALLGSLGYRIQVIASDTPDDCLIRADHAPASPLTRGAAAGTEQG